MADNMKDKEPGLSEPRTDQGFEEVLDLRGLSEDLVRKRQTLSVSVKELPSTKLSPSSYPIGPDFRDRRPLMYRNPFKELKRVELKGVEIYRPIMERFESFSNFYLYTFWSVFTVYCL